MTKTNYPKLYNAGQHTAFYLSQGLPSSTIVNLNDTTKFMYEFVELFVGSAHEKYDFISNGLGLLSDVISSVATEELNGMFELRIEYDSGGFLVDKIKEEMIIKAKVNDKQDEQLFRIYSITKNHENDNLIINAQHITYDLGNNFVEKIEARNMTKKQVMELIGSSTNYEHPFNVTSSNNTTRSSTNLYRTNPLQMIGGMAGSILQIWGGQIERDNFNLIMHDRRGSDDGVKVLYKKNLTGLTAKFDIENLVTRIFPYVYIPATDDEPEQLITVPGKYIDSPYINNYEMPYILPVDFSYEEGIETSQDLLSASQNWFVETGRDNPRVEMEVQFEHLWETEEYKDVAALELVGMGDTITVEHSKLKVEGTAIVNRIEYDVIAGKNIAVDVGHVKAKFTDKVNQVVSVVDKVDEIEQSANQALKTANGKNAIYYGPDEPTGNLVKDDLWFRVVDGEYTRTYRFDGIQWQLVVSKDVADIETVANDAHNRANQSVATANLASQNAVEAINQAQDAFDDAQLALTTAQGLTNRMSSVEGDISTLNQTTQSFATRIENAEGDISTLTQTSQGLQRRVADAEDNITSVTQLADTLQVGLSNARGDINQLTLTAESMQSTISDLEDETQSQITQLSNNINARVEKGDVINQINVSTEDILISGKKLILDGDTTVTGTFRVSNANITSVDAGKMTTGTLDAGQVNIINLNASNINSGTLNANNVTIHGGSTSNFTRINGDNIYSEGRFSRDFGQGQTAEYQSYTEAYNGAYRSGIISKTANGKTLTGITRWLVLSDKGLSTQRSKHSGSSDYNGARFIDFFADETLTSDVIGQGMHIYSGQNLKIESHYGIDIVHADDHMTNLTSAGLRVHANDTGLVLKRRNAYTSTSGQSITFRASDDTVMGVLSQPNNDYNMHLRTFFGDYLILGSRQEVHIKDQDGNGWRDMVARDYKINTGHRAYINGTGSGNTAEAGDIGGVNSNGAPVLKSSGIRVRDSDINFYLAVHATGELRVTDLLGAGGSGYRPVRAGEFIEASSRTYKTNIKAMTTSALDEINKLSIVNFNLKIDKENGINDLKTGLIAEESPHFSTADNMAIRTNKLIMYNTKAIQELDTKLNLTREELILKVAQLEQRINELESVA